MARQFLFRDLLTFKRKISIKPEINRIILRMLVFSDSLIREVGHVDKELIVKSLKNFFRYSIFLVGNLSAQIIEIRWLWNSPGILQ